MYKRQTLLSGDALVYADGSVQIMTNLTGKLVLALPQGALSASSVGVDLSLIHICSLRR